MNADLTFGTVVYKKQWDDPDKGSSRQSVARGVNTPDVMTVRNQTYINQATKVAGKKYTMRFERHSVDATTGKPYITAAHVVLEVPELAIAGDVSALEQKLIESLDTNILSANIVNGEL